MKKIIFSLVLVFCSLYAISQQNGTIKGLILGKDSLPVSNASVLLLNTPLGAVSNQAGRFEIKSVRSGFYQLQLSAVGYAQQVQSMTLEEGSAKEIIYYLEQVSNQLDEVVVSAEKMEDKVQKVPLAVSTFNSRQVAEFRLWNLQEITALVPNLYSANPGDNRNVTSIRGIVTTSYDPAIATYIDGVSQFNLDTYIPQLMDVERIEVLRGPQGTLYGRNALGGVIHVLTKQPLNRTETFVELNAGNYAQQRYTVGFKTPIISGKLFAGAALQYQSRDGFYQNSYNERDFDSQYQFTGNYYLKYYPGKQWSLVANVKHHNNRNDGAFPLSSDKTTAFREPYQLSQNATATMQDDAFNASLSVTHSGKNVLFNSLTAYQSNFRVYDKPLDGDFSPLDIITIFNNYGNRYNKVNVFTQEFRFSSPASDAARLQWTGGAFFFHQDNPVKQATGFGSQAPLFGIPDSNFSFININSGKNTGMALYGQATYKLTQKLSITAGLRFDYENKKLSVQGDYLKEPDPPFTVRPDTSADAGFSAISPKLGLTYMLSENNLLYVTYSRGFRTGGLTPLSSDPSQPPLFAYDPEFSDNIEAGWKNTWWRNRLRLNIAAFYTRISQAQVPTLLLPDAVTVIRNAGTVESKGIEMEIAATPVKGLEVMYNLGITDAAFTRLRLSQNGQEVNLDGNRQIFTPGSTSMLMAQYSLPVKTKKPFKLVFRAEYVHLGSQYFDLANTIKQDAYALVNGRAGFSMSRLDFFLWVRNLGQQKYIAYGYDFGGVHLGNPRTYGATVQFRF
jgi:iron complex outermembrane receptor protein